MSERRLFRLNHLFELFSFSLPLETTGLISGDGAEAASEELEPASWDSVTEEREVDGIGIGGTGGTSTVLFRCSELLLEDDGPRIDRRPMDGECRSEPKKPLPPPEGEATVGDEVEVSTLLGATGMSKDSDGCGIGIGCGAAVVNGDVNVGGDGSG